MAYDAEKLGTALRCDCCGEPSADLNSELLCIECREDEPVDEDEDPEDFIDTSDAAMLREHGTWF